MAYTKEQSKIYKAKYYLIHRKEILTLRKQYSSSHKDKIKKYQKENRKVNGKRYHLKYNYKLTPEQFRQMQLDQGLVCAICKEYIINWHIDHNHKTGQVRGLLCKDCNFGIGRLKDSPDICINASNYLREK